MKNMITAIKRYFAPTLLVGIVVALVVFLTIWFRGEAVIEQIAIQGDINAAQEKETLTVLEPHVIANSFTTVSLDNVADEIAQIDWVDKVSLRRSWPDTLIVDVKPHKPIARWNKASFISANGSIFDETAQSIMNLPQLYAEKGQEKQVMHFYLQAVEVLNPYQIKIDALHFTGAGTWKLLLSNDLIVHVDNVEPASKMQHFIETLNSDLRSRKSQIAAADLRYPHGFAIQWKTNKRS